MGNSVNPDFAACGVQTAAQWDAWDPQKKPNAGYVTQYTFNPDRLVDLAAGNRSASIATVVGDPASCPKVNLDTMEKTRNRYYDAHQAFKEHPTPGTFQAFVEASERFAVGYAQHGAPTPGFRHVVGNPYK